ncbi:MAG: glutamine--tRNA ligase, partial [Syntrophales bacterium]|nr:glutamine--tRNA ligase [Syntrophales bacterium]
VIYRIKRTPHYRTGDQWIIYPMYDFAHCLSDYIEGITHSICTLEFENNRPLYDWILEELVEDPRPRQIEFARLNLSYTVLSKRRLIEMVDSGVVSGWDDPRMPTIAGMRRRGYPAAAIRAFAAKIGVAKKDNLVDMALLEACVRDELNETAPRVMGVLRPLKVVIENYPEAQMEELEMANHPQRPEMGSRKVPFAREIYIDEEDFLEVPPKKYKRLAPGGEVRLRGAYIIRHIATVKDEETGTIKELRCLYDPDTLSGPPADGRKVEGVIHWVAARYAVPAEVRLYDRLFSVPDPGAADDYLQLINPRSLTILKDCPVEMSLKDAPPGSRFQFERVGYFCVDARDSRPDGLVLNRIVPLRDTWSKIAGK